MSNTKNTFNNAVITNKDKSSMGGNVSKGRRLFLFCDGTWQTKRQEHPTNISLLDDCVAPYGADGKQQISFHFNGVGTESLMDKFMSGVFGDSYLSQSGLSDKVKEAYRQLVDVYQPGDEIVLVGFSRGAYTARSLAGMIYKCGILDKSKLMQDCDGDLCEMKWDSILDDAFAFYKNTDIKPSHSQAYDYRLKHSHTLPGSAERLENISAMLCFDTVGAKGIPSTFGWLSRWSKSTRFYDFHDDRVNRLVKNAIHLVAADEERELYDVSPMTADADHMDKTHLEQIWMPGDHGAVGGGEPSTRGLSDYAALRAVERLESLTGAKFDPEKLAQTFKPDLSVKPEGGFTQLTNIFNRAVMGQAPRSAPAPTDILDPSLMMRYSRFGLLPKPLAAYGDGLTTLLNRPQPVLWQAPHSPIESPMQSPLGKLGIA
jgi:hypothetical protein